MQKKKKMLYIMLSLVALVWGVVFYQVYAYFFSTPVYAEQQQEKIVNIDEIKRDTFSIVANYRDPFLGKKARQTRLKNSNEGSAQVSKRRNSIPKVVKAEKPWPLISYNGMIKNNNSNWKVAIIKVNGKERLVKEGLVINDLKILKIEKKMIKIQFQKEHKTITK